MENNSVPQIAVLMSAYNGEKYLREQLDSIFSQEDVCLTLFVRDDGSTDNTIGILEEYSQNHPLVIWNEHRNVGVGESFLRLVKRYAHEPGFEYFAFADQDDIWLKDKLITAVNSIIHSRFEGPILYSSNQTILMNDEIKGPRYAEPQTTELIPHISVNTISGCTFVMNKALADLIADADMPDQKVLKRRIHDGWIMLVAIVCGNVIYDESSHILYRIHSNNAVGLKNVSIQERKKRLWRMIMRDKEANIRKNTATELLRLYPDMRKKDAEVLSVFANYQNSFRDRTALLNNQEIIRGCPEKAWVFKLKVLLGFV